VSCLYKFCFFLLTDSSLIQDFNAKQGDWLLNLERDSLILITSDPGLKSRFTQACEFLLFKAHICDSLSSFLADDKLKPHTVFFDIPEHLSASAGDIQKLMDHFQNEVDLFIITPINEEALLTAQKLFLNHLVDRQVFLETFLSEFLIFLKGLCEFYEINSQDFFPETLIAFNAYFYLPLNQKYIPVVNENLILSESKFKKFETAKLLYIHKQSVNAYNQHIEYYFDRFNIGLRKRLRSKFYQVLSQWREALMVGLTSIPRPNEFPGSVDDLSLHLDTINDYLRESPDPWFLLFEMTQSTLLQFERSSLDLIVASFLADHFSQTEHARMIELKWAYACCQNLSPSLFYKKWLFNSTQLSEEEKVVFQSFPHQLSVSLQGQLKEDFYKYCEGFTTKQSPADLNSFYVHLYMAEKIVLGFSQAHKNKYNKPDLLHSALVSVKNENILNEAWIEEYRLMFAKPNLQQRKESPQ